MEEPNYIDQLSDWPDAGKKLVLPQDRDLNNDLKPNDQVDNQKESDDIDFKKAA